MISGSLDSFAGLFGMLDTIIGLPVVGDLVSGLLPMSGSADLLTGSAGPIGSAADGFDVIGS